MDAAETHLFNRPGDRASPLPNLSDREGVNRTRSGGLNFSRTAKKADFAGYVLGEETEQILSRQLNRVRLIPPLRQIDTSVLDQTTRHARLWATLNATVRLSPTRTLKTASTLALAHEDFGLLNQQRFYFRETDVSPRFGGLNRNEQDQTLRRGTFYQQALLTLRHRRPAQVTSLYANLEAGNGRADRGYLNDIPRGLGTPLFYRHHLDRRDQTAAFGVQAMHSRPLSRRWLIEGRLGAQRQVNRSDQTGTSSDRAGVERYRPDLSLRAFGLTDWQADARLGAFYRRNRLSLLGSLGAWYWQSNRGAFGQYQQTALLPRLYAEYRTSAPTTFRLSYQRRPQQPGLSQFWPLPDSTNAQRISVGNPRLVPFLTHSYEASTQLVLGGGNNLTVSAQVDQTPNPIISVNRADSLQLPTLGLDQRGDVGRFALTVFWLRFNRDSPFQWNGFLQVGMLETLIGSNEALQQFNNAYLFAALGLRWTASARTSLKADVNQNLFRQVAAQTSRLNYRIEASLGLESRLGPRTYLTTKVRHTQNFNTEQRPVGYTLLDASLRRYVLKENRLSLELGVQNLFNVSRLYEYRSDTFQQQEQFTNRLPRFGQLGLTYHFSRWR